MNEEMEVASAEIMPVGSDVMERLERAQIDVAIATAHHYPRSMAKFKKSAEEMITVDEETAESCIYRRPVGDGKFAEGKSIRMAEVVGSCYENLRYGAKIVEVDPKGRFVKAQGFGHDLEKNIGATSEVIESTVTKNGQPYSERMRIVVAKACLKKALRDAIFTVVPQALCKSLEDLARKTAIGDATTLAKRRDAVVKWLNILGVDMKRVWAALKIKGSEDIGLDQLETLTGLKTAIKEGMAVDEAFPPINEDGTPVDTSKSKADQLAAKLGKKEEPAQTPSKESLVARVLELMESVKASKIKVAFDALKLSNETDDWQETTVENLITLKSLLTAAK